MSTPTVCEVHWQFSFAELLGDELGDEAASVTIVDTSPYALADPSAWPGRVEEQYGLRGFTPIAAPDGHVAAWEATDHRDQTVKVLVRAEREGDTR